MNKKVKLILTSLVFIGIFVILNFTFSEENNSKIKNNKEIVNDIEEESLNILIGYYEDQYHDFKLEAEEIITTYNTDINKSKLKHLLIYMNGLCQEYNVNYDLAKSLISIESSWKSKAISNSKAVGLMQIRYAAAKDFETPHKFMNDPYINLTVGIKYLSKMLGQFNYDTPTALVAYNEGHVYASRYKKEYIDNSKYVKKIEKLLDSNLLAMN